MYTRAMSKTSNANYRIWLNIKARPSAGLDPAWVKDFDAFNAYIGDKPTPDCRLMRTDKTKGYVPNNIYWKETKAGMRLAPKTPNLTNEITENMTHWDKLRLLAKTLGPVPEDLKTPEKEPEQTVEQYLETIIEEWREFYHMRFVNPKLQEEFHRTKGAITLQQEYEIIAQGKEDFEKWVQEPLQQQDLEKCREAFLLRQSRRTP